MGKTIQFAVTHNKDYGRRTNYLCCFIDTDILHLNFLGQSVIILNSSEAAVAIMERRSANYSGRPMLYSLAEYMITLVQYSVVQY